MLGGGEWSVRGDQVGTGEDRSSNSCWGVISLRSCLASWNPLRDLEELDLPCLERVPTPPLILQPQ